MTAQATSPPSLQDLHDIVVPAGVPWWPPQPGWYLLVAIVLALAVVLTIIIMRRHRATAYRRLALDQLRAIRDDRAVERLPALLKRVAIDAHSRERVAALSGTAWLAFLDEHGGAGRFARGSGATLLDLSYGRPRSEPPDARLVKTLLDDAEAWIRAQGVPAA